MCSSECLETAKIITFVYYFNKLARKFVSQFGSVSLSLSLSISPFFPHKSRGRTYSCEIFYVSGRHISLHEFSGQLDRFQHVILHCYTLTRLLRTSRRRVELKQSTKCLSRLWRSRARRPSNNCEARSGRSVGPLCGRIPRGTVTSILPISSSWRCPRSVSVRST